MCSSNGKDYLLNVIKEEGIDRLIIVGCSSRTIGLIFSRWLREAGYEDYHLEIVDIREGIIFQSKSSDIKTLNDAIYSSILQGIARATNNKGTKVLRFDIERSCLVIGGGVAGLTAAGDLVKRGIGVFLVEREEQLGGTIQNTKTIFPDSIDTNALLEGRLKRMEGAKVYLGATLKAINGHVGDYTVSIETKDGCEEIRVGAIICATGAGFKQPVGYFNYPSDNLLSFLDLEMSNEILDKDYVFIQNIRKDYVDIGRGINTLLCLKHAYLAKQGKPKQRVIVLFKNIPDHYLSMQALCTNAGIEFVHYDNIADINAEGLTYSDEGVKRGINNAIFALPLVWEASRLEDTIVNGLHLQIDSNGFLVERLNKLRTEDILPNGVFIAGSCHQPMPLHDIILQGHGAASRAYNLLSNDILTKNAKISRIEQIYCRACGRCVKSCPYEAISLKESDGKQYADVDEAVCTGCGVCMGVCISGAARVYNQDDKAIMAEVVAALSS